MYMKRRINQKILDERNRIMIQKLQQGASTKQLSKELRISRERIAQIFFSLTNHSLAEERLIARLHNAKLSRQTYLRKCKNCKQTFIPSRLTRVYCSLLCGHRYNYSNQRSKKIKQCTYCGKDYHPYRSNKPTFGFCSRKHFFKFGGSRKISKDSYVGTN